MGTKSLNSKVVLFLEWSSKGRDFEIDLPLMYFFEKILCWETKYISIFNLPRILATNPDLIIMSNTTGARENLKIARLIEDSGIPLFSHVSEGMFRENDIEEFVWGWNKKEKRFSEILSTLWSKKAYDMSVKAFPETNKTYKISGSIGFDKYKIYKQNKIDIAGYKKVIGYAGFDFYNIKSKKKEFITNNKLKIYEKVMEWIESTQNTLKYLIENNQDTLFLIKSHPGDGNKVPIEVDSLLDNKNVQMIDKNISIVDVIENSDIWLNINSSTNLEAWLLGKPSLSFNKDESMFSSDVIYGSIIEDDYKKIQTHIDEFYLTEKIKNFEEKKELREKLISNYIGFSDGFNHVRFISFLKPYIDKIERDEIKRGKWKISLNQKIKGYFRHLLFLISKRKHNRHILKRWAKAYDIFDKTEVLEQKRLRYPDFDNFYSKNQEEINSIYLSWYKNWKKELDIKE